MSANTVSKFADTVVVPESREECVYLCGAAEEASRFEDMVALMRHVVTFEQELTVDERNLFSVAYKELVGLRRKSLRRLGDLATELLPSSEHERALLLAMQKDVRDELVALCNEALDTIERALLPRSILSESTVFYHKMTADYLRYLAEFSGADERRGYADRASEAYARARELAQSHGLSATNPVRLGLALNLSVFEFEIRSDVREAFEVAAEALAEARENVEEMLEAHRKDATLIMQLLRDNLQLWSGAVASVTNGDGERNGKASPVAQPVPTDVMLGEDDATSDFDTPKLGTDPVMGASAITA